MIRLLLVLLTVVGLQAQTDALKSKVPALMKDLNTYHQNLVGKEITREISLDFLHVFNTRIQDLGGELRSAGYTREDSDLREAAGRFVNFQRDSIPEMIDILDRVRASLK